MSICPLLVVSVLSGARAVRPNRRDQASVKDTMNFEAFDRPHDEVKTQSWSRQVETRPYSMLSYDSESSVGASFGAWLAPKNLEVPQGRMVNVTYAVFTSNIQKYRNKLVSVMETWAAPLLREGRFFVVGPSNYSYDKTGIIPSTCGDSPQSLACKEATIMEEAARRGTDWVVITGEDNYVDVAKFDALLARQPYGDVPTTLGIVGCGGNNFCPELGGGGPGLCGGAGYALNQAAVRKIVTTGEHELMKEYTEEFRGYPNDMATSCVLKKRGVRMTFPDGGGELVGNPTMARMHYENYLHSGFLTLHYIPPEIMRWIHARLNHDEAKARRLEAKAFDERGCCEDCTTSPSPEGKQQQLQHCWEIMAYESWRPSGQAGARYQGIAPHQRSG